jgi:hypothetical protein
MSTHDNKTWESTKHHYGRVQPGKGYSAKSQTMLGVRHRTTTAGLGLITISFLSLRVSDYLLKKGGEKCQQ